MSLYSDINSNTPYANPQVVDIDAVIQSISNIMQVRKTELLFLPEFGMDGDDALFEIIDDVGALIIFQTIVNNISVWDPRVSLNLGQSYVTPDVDNNAYQATIVFSIIGLEGEYAVTQLV